MAEKNKKTEYSSGAGILETLLVNTGLRGLIDSLKPDPAITLQAGKTQVDGMQRINHAEEVTVVRR